MNRPLRVVIDANIHYSALRRGDSPVHEVEDAWQRAFVRPLTSPQVQREVRRVVRKKSLGLSEDDIFKFLALYDARCEMIIPPPGLRTAQCRDPKDQRYLDLAHAAAADFIISGDHDLLAMKETSPAPVLTPRVFTERFL